MSGLRSYFLHITAACLLVNLSLALLPKGKLQKPLRFCGSLVMLLAVVAPILRLESGDFARGFVSWQADAASLRQELEEESRAMLEARIKQECEAYVWDKAVALGLTVEIELGYGKDALYPYPVSAVVTGQYTHEQRLHLQSILEDELGIAKERQVWIEA